MRVTLLAFLSSMLFLSACSLRQKEIYLDDLNLAKFRSGWRPSRDSKSVTGKTLSVAGITYERGVGTHATSTAKVKLHKSAKSFSAFVGVDDANTGSIEFKVELDGVLAWESGLMLKGQAAKKIELDLFDVDIMTLIVTDGNNGIGNDHADWCDAVITFEGEEPELTLYNDWEWITPKSELASAKAAVIPYPVQAKWHEGSLTLTELALGEITGQAKTAASALGRMAEALGISLKTGSPQANITLKIEELPSSKSAEAYTIEISPRGIAITANSASGLFYGVQTLRQLAQKVDENIEIPYCSITDHPAFAIRGFMHDVGRNFISIEELKIQMDMMSLYKINVFQFHLTDHPAYRLESKKYPELNDAKNMSRHEGKYYTIEEMKDFIKFCEERHITVLPEFDMPGHSHYFKKAFGISMQTDEGVKIIKELIDEWLEIFPSPWFHLGTDEVKLTRETFVEEMTKYVRAKGKKTISWHHGLAPFDDKTIQQLWNAPRANNPIIDSLGYVNTDDPIMQIRNYFFRQYCYVEKGDENNLGGILCYWPDEPVVDEDAEMRIAPVYPAIAAFGERIWQGNPNDWPVIAKEVSYHGAPVIDAGRHEAYAEFENRLAVHREKFFRPFRPAQFPFVKNSNIRWRVIGPFPNNGDANAVMPPEQQIKDSYEVDDKTYDWQETWGGTVSLRYLYGLPKTKFEPTHTAYAVTYIHSDKEQELNAWINVSRKHLAWPQGYNPNQGDWACEGSRVWVNDQIVNPPKWEKPTKYRAPITEESYIYRTPSKIVLKKGWNKVMIKSTNKFTPWSITFLPLKYDGKGFQEIKGLKYSTNPKSD